MNSSINRQRVLPLEPKPAAIITTCKKDENYIKLIKKDVDDLFQYWFGIRNWIQYRNSLEVLSRFAYYSLTTLSGLQTLGEEYTNIVLINDNQLKVPSFKRRLLLVILQSAGQIVFKQSINHLREILDSPTVNLWPKQLNDPRTRSKAYDAIPIIEQIANYIVKLNTALFFIGSPFYSLINRLLSINHTALRKWNGDATSGWLYKFIGYTSLIQLILTICIQYYSSLIIKLNLKSDDQQYIISSKSDAKTDQNQCFSNDDHSNDFNMKCSLCLDRRFQTTSTMCGHLFCWKCIHEWLKVKDECPMCRQRIKQSRLIYLQNHD